MARKELDTSTCGVPGCNNKQDSPPMISIKVNGKWKQVIPCTECKLKLARGEDLSK